MFVFTFVRAQAQQKYDPTNATPTVFYIGEEDGKYEQLVKNYSTLLFTVCDNDMQVSFDHWSVLLKDIEDYANKSQVDLKGTKLWMNVFWSKDGLIEHIVFYPKPNSKNMNYDSVKNMLYNFTKEYQSPLKYATKYSHYGSASFPVFSKSIIGPEK